MDYDVDYHNLIPLYDEQGMWKDFTEIHIPEWNHNDDGTIKIRIKTTRRVMIDKWIALYVHQGGNIYDRQETDRLFRRAWIIKMGVTTQYTEHKIYGITLTVLKSDLLLIQKTSKLIKGLEFFWS